MYYRKGVLRKQSIEEGFPIHLVYITFVALYKLVTCVCVCVIWFINLDYIKWQEIKPFLPIFYVRNGSLSTNLINNLCRLISFLIILNKDQNDAILSRISINILNRI